MAKAKPRPKRNSKSRKEAVKRGEAENYENERPVKQDETTNTLPPNNKEEERESSPVTETEPLITPRTDVTPVLRILLWNVTSLRSVTAENKGLQLQSLVEEQNPDIICLNETKISEDMIPQFADALPGYKADFACAAKKGYSGVATFYKASLNVTLHGVGVGVEEHDNEGRVLIHRVANDNGSLPKIFYLVNSYVVNAGRGLPRLEYKVQEWVPALVARLEELQKEAPVLWLGDLNVAPAEIDIWNSKANRKTAGHTPEEREQFSQLLAEGRWVDVFRAMYPTKQQFTYWSKL